jgi:hypothetical protein
MNSSNFQSKLIIMSMKKLSTKMGHSSKLIDVQTFQVILQFTLMHLELIDKRKE